jgi:hypothetical protein
MSDPIVSANTEAAQAGVYPQRFNKREQKLIEALNVVKYAGAFTTEGGAAAEAITIPGVLATDLVFIQLAVAGAVPRTVLSAVPTADTITVTFSGDPDDDHELFYQVLRATV